MKAFMIAGKYCLETGENGQSPERPEPKQPET